MAKDEVRVFVSSNEAKSKAGRSQEVGGWLIEQLRVKKIPSPFKKFDNGDLVLDIYLVDASLMNKNVLSFEADPDFPRPDLETAQSLGEIHLNPGYIKKAKEDFDFMLIHGFLHLLGYDHGKKNDRIEMEKLENWLYKNLKSVF